MGTIENSKKKVSVMSNPWDPNSNQQQYPPTQQYPVQPGYGYPPPVPAGPPPKKNTGLIIGLVAAIVAIAAGVTVYLITKKDDNSSASSAAVGQSQPVSPSPSAVTSASPESSSPQTPAMTSTPQQSSLPAPPAGPTGSSLSSESKVVAPPSGSDEAAIQQAAKNFMDGALTGDKNKISQSVCAIAAQNIPDLSAVAAGLPQGVDISSMVQITVKDVKVTGDTASGQLSMSVMGNNMGQNLPTKFVKEGGTWKICG